MPKIKETVPVAKQPDELLKEIGSFTAVARWHPMLANVEAQGETVGSVRTAESKDGSKQVERLLELVPYQRFYIYGIVSTPMPVSDYIAEFSVEDPGDGSSTVVWSCEFETTPDDDGKVVETIRNFLKVGLENLQAMYPQASAAFG